MSSSQGESTSVAGANRRRPKQEAQMTKLVLRCVTQGTFLMALIAALSFSPAFAMGGGGGGGAGGGAGGGGTYPSSLLRPDPPNMKRGIAVLASLSALVAVGYFTVRKWAIRHETLTFYDAARDNRPVAVDIAVRRVQKMQANAGVIT